MNLPLEMVDKILQYDGRWKYRKGTFVDIIHPTILKNYHDLLEPLITKKKKIFKTNLKIKRYKYYFCPGEDNSSIIKERTENFYFQIDFDSLPGVGLCYDYYWNHNDFKISYFDDRFYLGQYEGRERVSY